MSHKRIGNLEVAKELVQVVEEIAPGTGVSADGFWAAMEKVLTEFAGENAGLLKERDALQAKIDAYYLKHQGKPIDEADYIAFLGSIGYLAPEVPDFKIQTSNVDAEIASIPGPQLVCPIDNARFVLNAANARWGSLLDAFYGTDAGPSVKEFPKGAEYSPVRGAEVFKYAHAELDKYYPLANGAKYGDVTRYALGGNGKLEATLKNKQTVGLANPAQFVGYSKNGSELSQVVLRHNNLHFIIQIDPSSKIGSTHAAGVKDILVESAITAIADCEDSVAAVDAEDKANVYRNWLGLMKGDLKAGLGGGKTRALNPDMKFQTPSGGELVLPGRVVLLVRHVGLHLYTDAIRFADSQRQVPENIMDAMVTALAAIHDLKKPAGQVANSRTKSMYCVRPKLHGPKEVNYVVRIFNRIEELLNIPHATMKMGIMDEERRTSVNLKQCIYEAAGVPGANNGRCIFINTGFLDRTGDEIHTMMRHGPCLPKADIKKATWRLAYEANNVDIGLEVGLDGKGQIGKGMFAMPDLMKQLLETKAGELKQGATTAWCPSPVASTLHALHYHEVDVFATQAKLKSRSKARIADILKPPVLDRKLTKEEIDHEVRDNLQGCLGYVSRWVDLGVGCSKVPDINGVGLMEDRATLRISSQLLMNWVHHNVITREQVLQTAYELADFVDKQNNKVVLAVNNYNNNPFNCAMEMIFNGIECPNGLTEGTLAKYRRAEKERLKQMKQAKL